MYTVPHYRRKPRINDKIRIGNSSPLQQSIFKLVELNTWTQPIEIITKVKVYKFKGKSSRASNAEVHRALEQLVNLGVLEKR